MAILWILFSYQKDLFAFMFSSHQSINKISGRIFDNDKYRGLCRGVVDGQDPKIKYRLPYNAANFLFAVESQDKLSSKVFNSMKSLTNDLVSEQSSNHFSRILAESGLYFELWISKNYEYDTEKWLRIRKNEKIRKQRKSVKLKETERISTLKTLA